MAQVKFQSSAQAVPFSPVTEPDLVPSMKQELGRQLGYMREDQRMRLQNEEQIYAQKLQDLRTNQALAATYRQQDLEALSSFSGNLTKMLLTARTKQLEDMEAEGYNLGYEQGIAPDDQVRWDAQEAAVIAAQEAHGRVEDALAASGAPFSVVDRWRRLGGRQKLGYARAIAEQAGSAWGSTLQRLLRSDNETKITITDENGQAVTFTPSEADTPEKQIAAAAALRKQYMVANGLTQFPKEFVNKYAWKEMRDQETAVLSGFASEYEKQRNLDGYNETLANFSSRVKADPNGALSEAMSNLRRFGATDNGKNFNTLLELIDDEKTIRGLREEESFMKGKKWKDVKGKELDEALFRIRSRQQTLNELDRAEERQRANEQADQFIQYWKDREAKGGGPPTDEEIGKAQFYLMQEFDGYTDPRINAMTAVSADAEFKKRLITQFTQMERTSRLSEADVNDPRVPKEVRDQFINEARRQDQQRNASPEFKNLKKSLQDALEQSARLVPTAVKSWTLGVAITDVHARFDSDVRTAMSGGMDSGTAAQKTFEKLLKEINDGALDPSNSKKIRTGRYRINGDPAEGETGAFGYFEALQGLNGPTAAASVAKAKEHFAAVARKMSPGGGGTASLDVAALIPKPILEDAIKNGGKPDYQPPPIANYISRLTNYKVSPWQVLQRQAKAQRLGEIPYPEGMIAAMQSVDPGFQRLLNGMQTQNRVGRALISGNKPFNPAVIPNGWGKWVLEASKQYNLDPSLLAGLLDQESSWNNNARSESGAQGLGQFMPGTAAEQGVDVGDPKSSIFGAAKYLDKLRKQFNGSINMALYAYNGGPGAIAKYGGPIPGSSENQEFLSNVIAKAKKYGWNSGTTSPFAEPALLNNSLRHVYTVGSIGGGSTGPHLDGKPVRPGTTETDPSLPRIRATTLDKWVKVKVNGKVVPLSSWETTDDDTEHRARGSFGHDWAPNHDQPFNVYLTGGAKVVANLPSRTGDKLIIELPDGRRFSFIHGRAARLN